MQPLLIGGVLMSNSNGYFVYKHTNLINGKVYKSVLDAANDLCVHESSIRQVRNGKRKSAGGCHFEDAK